MKHKIQDTTMSAKERYRVEDSLVESLDMQRQPEPLGGVTTEETKTSTGNADDERASAAKVEQPDKLMESVKAFIRNIDINTL